MRPPRVAIWNYTTTRTRGGVENFCWGLARVLERRGVEVGLFSGRGPIREPGLRVPLFEAGGLSRQAIPYVPGTSGLGDLGKLSERLSHALLMWPKIVAFDPDIVHVMKSFDLPAALALRRRRGARIVLSWHGNESFLGAARLAARVDASTACSEYVVSTLPAGIPRPRVVPNGIDVGSFRPSAGERGPGKRLLVCARLESVKGVDFAIDVLAGSSHLEAELWIAGEGRERRNLEAKVLALGLGARVRFLGGLEHAALPRVYQSVDALLVPTRVPETFSIVAAEAMASGIPVIGSRCGALPEVLGDAAGALLDDREVATWAAAVDRLLEDSERRRTAAGLGRARALARYGWPAVGDAMLEVYRGTTPPCSGIDSLLEPPG